MHHGLRGGWTPLLDQELSFVEHITALTRSCFNHLRQLRVVSRSLSASSTCTLVHAFKVNRLDNCSSLYCGLPQVRLQPLDGVLRAAARIIVIIVDRSITQQRRSQVWTYQ